MTNFRPFQTADDNFKFDENCKKLSKRVENTVGKGEIAHNEQYLLCPQCFQKTRKNQGLFGKGLKPLSTIYWSYQGDQHAHRYVPVFFLPVVCTSFSKLLNCFPREDHCK